MDDETPDTPPDEATPAVDPGEPDALPHTEPTGEVQPVDLRDWVDFDEDAARRVRIFTTASLQQDLWCVEPQQSTSVLRFADTDVVEVAGDDDVLGGKLGVRTSQDRQHVAARDVAVDRPLADGHLDGKLEPRDRSLAAFGLP